MMAVSLVPYHLAHLVYKDALIYNKLYTEFGCFLFPVHVKLLLQVKTYSVFIKIIY